MADLRDLLQNVRNVKTKGDAALARINAVKEALGLSRTSARGSTATVSVPLRPPSPSIPISPMRSVQVPSTQVPNEPSFYTPVPLTRVGNTGNDAVPMLDTEFGFSSSPVSPVPTRRLGGKLDIVTKEIHVGSRGAVSYRAPTGRENAKPIFLKRYQYDQCRNGTLKGVDQQECIDTMSKRSVRRWRCGAARDGKFKASSEEIARYCDCEHSIPYDWVDDLGFHDLSAEIVEVRTKTSEERETYYLRSIAEILNVENNTGSSVPRRHSSSEDDGDSDEDIDDDDAEDAPSAKRPALGSDNIVRIEKPGNRWFEDALLAFCKLQNVQDPANDIEEALEKITEDDLKMQDQIDQIPNIVWECFVLCYAIMNENCKKGQFHLAMQYAPIGLLEQVWLFVRIIDDFQSNDAPMDEP